MAALWKEVRAQLLGDHRGIQSVCHVNCWTWSAMLSRVHAVRVCLFAIWSNLILGLSSRILHNGRCIVKVPSLHDCLTLQPFSRSGRRELQARRPPSVCTFLSLRPSCLRFGFATVCCTQTILTTLPTQLNPSATDPNGLFCFRAWPRSNGDARLRQPRASPRRPSQQQMLSRPMLPPWLRLSWQSFQDASGMGSRRSWRPSEP